MQDTRNDADDTAAIEGAWVLPQWGQPVRLTAAPQPAGTPETIYWHATSTLALPDADLTVLLETTDADHPIVQGWWDGEQWCLCESGGTAEPGSVRRWAEVVGVNVKLNGPL